MNVPFDCRQNIPKMNPKVDFLSTSQRAPLTLVSKQQAKERAAPKFDCFCRLGSVESLQSIFDAHKTRKWKKRVLIGPKTFLVPTNNESRAKERKSAVFVAALIFKIFRLLWNSIFWQQQPFDLWQTTRQFWQKNYQDKVGASLTDDDSSISLSWGALSEFNLKIRSTIIQSRGGVEPLNECVPCLSLWRRVFKTKKVRWYVSQRDHTAWVQQATKSQDIDAINLPTWHIFNWFEARWQIGWEFQMESFLYRAHKWNVFQILHGLYEFSKTKKREKMVATQQGFWPLTKTCCYRAMTAF